jgi:predicted metalloprotease with PDZ domain
MRLLVGLLALALSPFASASPARYTLSWDGGPVLHVRAELSTADGRLLIAQGGGIDQLQDQWATFVRNLRVKGLPVGKIASTGKEGWTIPVRGALTVTYDVDLSYAEGRWPAGNEQAGRKFATALYTVTKPLFVYTADTQAAEIVFQLPEGWEVAAPWPSSTGRRFATARVEQLSENSIILGRFAHERLRVGALDLTIATPSESTVPGELGKVVSELGALAGELFPNTPPDQYLLTYFREPAEHGEAYTSSAAFTSPDSFGPASLIVSGNSLVHELLHYWIGGKIHAADSEQLAWFEEGFTEYYANRILALSGAVSASEIRARIANRLSGYEYFFVSPLFTDVTLKDAGKRKGSYRFGNYNGGWAIALALDVKIREATGGRATLDTAMRELFTKHGLTGSAVALDDISAAASAAAGHDLAPFFAKYVETREKLPTAELMRSLGWELIGQSYAADMILVESGGPTTLRRAIFGPASIPGPSR